MTKEVLLKELDELLIEGNKVLSTKRHMQGFPGIYVDSIKFKGWKTKVITFLKLFLEDRIEIIDVFIKANTTEYAIVASCVQALANVKDYIEKDFIDIEHKTGSNIEDILERIFTRFHKVARQLRSRFSSRNTLEIEDEYDVQDLLHALLRLYFDDIRAEEWTPSYAGKSARVDFLLKSEKTIIEVKKTRQGLADKEVGDQLIIDVDRYKAHPDCEKLICFVYDPEGRIGNPNGIMDDLNAQHEGFATVIIQPNM